MELKKLKDLIKNIEIDKTIILTYVSKDYLKLFYYWFKFFKKHNHNNLLVIALDKESYIKLNEMKIDSFLIKHNLRDNKRYRKELWKIRMKILSFIVSKGYNVFQTDIDAIWIKDIYKLWTNDKNDISVSLGNLKVCTPENVKKVWGFNLCLGIFGIKYSKRVVSFLKKIKEKTLDVEDDQVAFNWFLLEKKIKWKKNKNGSYIAKIDGVKIIAISNDFIFRMPKKDIWVYHFLFLETNDLNKKLDLAKKAVEYILSRD